MYHSVNCTPVDDDYTMSSEDVYIYIVCICILAVQMTNYVNLATPLCFLCKLGKKNALTSSLTGFDILSVFYETV